jgi:6-pyruvoyltetrahydropterin/6-carboxytetrahydropterin synthase
MPYKVRVEGRFAAAHALRGYDGSCERIHGHNFTVTAVAETAVLDDVGMAVDFKALDALLNDVLAVLDHRNLNELDAFAERNATAENIAAFVYRELAPHLEALGAKLRRVTVEESPKYVASFEPDL